MKYCILKALSVGSGIYKVVFISALGARVADSVKKQWGPFGPTGIQHVRDPALPLCSMFCSDDGNCNTDVNRDQKNIWIGQEPF